MSSIAFGFRLEFEEYPDATYEVFLGSGQTLLDFHQHFLAYTKFNPDIKASLFKCNESWIMGEEFALDCADKDSPVCTKKIAQIIDSPHQKLYYIYHFDVPIRIRISLFKIKRIEEDHILPEIIKSAETLPILYKRNNQIKGGTGTDTNIFNIENLLEQEEDDEDVDMPDKEEEELLLEEEERKEFTLSDDQNYSSEEEGEPGESGITDYEEE